MASRSSKERTPGNRRAGMLKRMAALAGLSLLGAVVRAEEPRPPEAPGLIIYHAGSLSSALKALEDQFTQKTGVRIQDVAGGSVSLARQLTAGRRACDLFASADYEVIDRMMKPAGFAAFTFRIAGGAMVLAYTKDSRNAGTIGASGAFHPPDAVPMAAPDWYAQLIQPGVTISGSHPFLDPGAYRADMIFQLAQDHYGVPNLYNELLAHYKIATAPGGLGRTFDYQFTYEHSACAAYKADHTGTYRYVRLPDEVSLGVPSLNHHYAKRSVTIPGLQVAGSSATVTIPAGRVTWGITLLNAAPNRENALAFLRLLLSSQGAALLNAAGPTAISPPVVSKDDFARLPAGLKALVQSQ
jgi:molybdate/tungstate transport system substrate-binding protein